MDEQTVRQHSLTAFITPMTRPIGVEHFYHDGRGPELRRVHWSRPQSCALRAIEYFCPDDTYDDAHLRHVRFVGPQAFMFTPEEVINYASSRVASFGQHHPAAALDHDHSEWLLSFNPRHLGRCRHFQLLFYDELLDVLCEELDFRAGAYLEIDHAA